MNLTKEQTEKIFELAGINIEYSGITSNDVSKALIKIEDKLACLVDSTDVNSSNAKVLIVDDLELSTYQLSALLKKIKVVPMVVHTKEEAISEIKKQKFDFIFVDLFLPDEEDGLAVMKFANEYRDEKNVDYKVIAISGTDDLNLVTDCFNVGVDEFVSKSSKWHEHVLKIVIDKSGPYTRKNFIRYDIDESTVTYNVKSLSKVDYVEELYNNIVTVLLTGVQNIILNLKEIKTFPVDYSKLFTDVYRKCSAAGGKFILLSPSATVKEALEFAYLNDVITVVDLAEEAFALLNT
ncbi:response regulator [bacterium]|nr:response regulator [bacterium]